MLSRTRSRRTAVQKQLESGVGSGISVIRERGQGAVEALGPRIETARDALAPKLETAKEAAGQALSEASEWAAPRIDSAREQAVTTVREKVAPAVTKALTTAAEASKPARKEAKNRTDAALAALRGEVGPPKKKRRAHRLTFLLGAGAVTGAVVALVVRRKEPTHNPYEPTNVGGGDPYAQPVTTQAPSAPITTMNEEIAGNINPSGTPTGGATEATTPTTESGNGEANATIDVTGDAVGLGADGGTGGASGRQRKRTRGGEPQ